MIRFVDLRYQGVGARFAFWDTVRDRFEIWLGFQAWDTWAAFESDCILGFPREGESAETALARRRTLCPPWVFEPATDAELGFRDGDESFSGRCPTCGQACFGVASEGSK